MRNLARWIAVATALLSAALIAGAPACNVRESVSNCETSRDCRLGFRCEPQGNFCMRDTGPLTIGFVTPLQGTIATDKPLIRGSLDLAASIVNGAGGVLGRPITFKEMEEAPAQLGASLTQLIEVDRVPALFGGITSDTGLQIQKRAAAAHVLTVSGDVASPAISEAEPARDRYFFRTMGLVGRSEALALALHVSGYPTFGARLCQRIQIVHTGSAYSDAYVPAFFDAFTKLGGCSGGEIVMSAAAQDNYDEQVAAAVAAKADCILMLQGREAGISMMSAVEKARAAPNLKAAWPRLQWLGASPLHAESTRKVALDAAPKPDASVLEGAILGDADTTPATEEYKYFNDHYNEAMGFSPETKTPRVANAFDAALLIAFAIEQAGSVEDRVAVRDAFWRVVDRSKGQTVYGPREADVMLRNIRRRRELGASCEDIQGSYCEFFYKGASGPLEFDDYGTVTVGAEIFTVKNGEFTSVKKYTVGDAAAFDALAPRPRTCK